MLNVRGLIRPQVAQWMLVTFAMLALPGTVHAHGFPLSLHYDSTANKLAVRPYSSSPLTGGFLNTDGLTVYRNFDEEESFSGSGGLYYTDFPGFVRASSIPANTSVGIRFLAPLRYWNSATQANDPLPVSNGYLEIMDAFEASAFVDHSGVTGANPLSLDIRWADDRRPQALHRLFFGHPARYSHRGGLVRTVWPVGGCLGDGRGVCGGRVSGERPFPDHPNYGITSSADYDEGVARLAATAVPEPSTLALAGIAVVATGCRWCRRRVAGG